MTLKTPSSVTDRTQTSDPEASLRETLRQQVDGAQATLEASIDALQRSGDGQALTQAQGQLDGLSRLQQRLAMASGASLASIRAEIMASVAATQALVQRALGAANGAQSAEATLQAASQAARQQVSGFVRDFYEKKIFDPYLRFASPEDEEAYRKREVERLRQIKEAQAKETPEGDLRAARLSIEQLHDAGAHGADKSPDYQSRMANLTGAADTLSSAMPKADAARVENDPTHAADGGKPSIATADPLDAIGPSKAVPSDIVAALRAAGVVAKPGLDAGHGVTTNVVAANPSKNYLG